MSRIFIPLFYVLLFTLPATFANGQAALPSTPLAEQAVDLQERRCMVCHGCYDAPCQLKLEASAGLERGASKAKVYDGTRLVSAELTRLFDDGLTEEQWRKKGFYPVLDQKHPKKGTMYRMLDLKKANPLPPSGPIAQDFDFALNRDQQCPKPDEFDKFAKKYPLWGMPYGLPGLDSQEHNLMTRWLDEGAPAPQPAPLSPAMQDQIARWESFLNGSSNKEKLMSRYLYEHLFLAGLYLEEADKPVWFRLVRSHTKPGRNIGLISTRRPFDDPRANEFYYRLQRMPLSILDKRHMLYRFDQDRMDWYRSLFLAPDYEVAKLPGYDPDTVINPFKRFRTIPIQSRYEFLLKEAQFSIMNFIKGPVCRGQIALSVIDDHFWVMFVNPGSAHPEMDAEFLSNESENLILPTVSTGTPVDLFRWRRFAKAEQRYAAAKAEYIGQEMDREDRTLDMDDLWQGDGINANASLTVFRHFDTASVVKGMVGQTPKTAWVINYPLLERIHYLLVAGFDVYGGATHQLESRLYMDFLRMEGEYNFLMFLPAADRPKIRDHWYRGARDSVKEHYFSTSEAFQRDTDIVFKTDDPKTELLQRMRKKIHGAEAKTYDYRVDASPAMITAFEKLENNVGAHNSFMPHVSFLNVIGSSRDEVYTIIRNAGHSNISQPFGEQERRLPEEDSLTVVRGFLGAYPNVFMQINESELANFVKNVASLKKPGDRTAIIDRYVVHRNAPWFWRLSDKFHKMYQERDGMAAGIFDYNRYYSQ
ncbi:MAG: fatty acid cis/trans isomerase [Halioglobus sp.]